MNVELYVHLVKQKRRTEHNLINHLYHVLITQGQDKVAALHGHMQVLMISEVLKCDTRMQLSD